MAVIKDKSQSINHKPLSDGVAQERAEKRKRNIDAALASTAGQGAAGVAEGEASKSALQSDKGGPQG
jgi:hypothetical protein